MYKNQTIIVSIYYLTRLKNKWLKINESRYNVSFVVSESIKKPFSIDLSIFTFLNQWLTIFSQYFFNSCKSVGLSHIAYIVIH